MGFTFELRLDESLTLTLRLKRLCSTFTILVILNPEIAATQEWNVSNLTFTRLILPLAYDVLMGPQPS